MSEELPHLLAAKAHSDKKQYGRKHMLLALRMRRDPDSFMIDSDDGKGIVGITHIPTGFQMHMPKDRIPPAVLLKQANLGRLKGLLGNIEALKPEKLMATAGGLQNKLIGHFNKNPKLEATVRKALSYNLVDPRNAWKNTAVAAGAGAVPGALAGTIPGEDVSAGNVAGGAATGAAMGALAGRFGPRAMQKGLGRILTNVLNPVSYRGTSHDYLKNQSASDMVRAIVRNEPMHTADAGRHALFRDYFNLPRHKGTESFFSTKSVGPDGRKLLGLNPADPRSKALVGEVDRAAVGSLYTSGKDQARRMVAGKPTLVNAGPMGNFHIQPDGSWSDTWDFALHPGERIDSGRNLLRALVTPFGQPSTVVGKAMSQRDALGAVTDPRKFQHIDQSFIDPLAKQLSSKYGVGVGDLSDLLRRAGSSRRHNADIRQALLDAMDGKKPNVDVGVLSKFWQPAAA